MTPEKAVQNRILAHLTKLANEGHPITKERRQAGGFGYKKGLPDVYFTYAGVHIEVEIKRPGGEMRTSQETWKRIFEANMVLHTVVDNADDFKYFMQNIIDNRKNIEHTMSSVIEYMKRGIRQ